MIEVKGIPMDPIEDKDILEYPFVVKNIPVNPLEEKDISVAQDIPGNPLSDKEIPENPVKE